MENFRKTYAGVKAIATLRCLFAAPATKFQRYDMHCLRQARKIDTML
jgi:hypothetical protein